MTEVVSSAVSVNKLFQKNPDLVAQSVVDAIYSERSIVNNLINTNFNGFSKLVERYFNYGVTNFKNGIPETFSLWLRDNTEADWVNQVESILSTIEGQAVVVDDAHLDYPLIYYMALKWLQDSPDYTLDRYEDKGSFLATKVATGEVGQFWEPSCSLLNTTLTIHLRETVPSPGFFEDIVTDIAPISVTTVLYQVKYHYLADDSDPEHEYKFWVYDPTENLYPELNIDTDDIIGELYYPIAPIRVEGEYVTNKNPELAESTTKLLDKLDIKYQDIEDALRDPANEDNIDNIDDAFIMFAMDMNSDEDIALRYLYEHFRRLKYISVIDQQDYLDWQAGAGAGDIPPNNNLIIRDAGSDRMSMSIKFNFITIQERTGIVGNPLPLPDLTTLIPEGPELDAGNSGLGEVTKQVVIGSNDEELWNDHYIVYRKQYTASTYIELTVHGLRHVMVPHPAKHVVRTLATFSDGGLYVPISVPAVERFNGIDQSNIFYESLNLMIYAVEITHLSWYETPGFFKALSKFFFAVAIISGLGGFAELIAEGITISEVAVTILVNLIEIEITKELLLLIVEEIGIDSALVIAAIAAITASTMVEGEELFDLLDAEQLLQAATLTIEVSNEIIKDDFLDLMADVEEFIDEAEQIQEELDAAQELLDNGVDISLYTLISNQPYVNFSESPEDFFYRTVHNTNPGVASLDSISTYVERALTLPQVTT